MVPHGCPMPPLLAWHLSPFFAWPHLPSMTLTFLLQVLCGFLKQCVCGCVHAHTCSSKVLCMLFLLPEKPFLTKSSFPSSPRKIRQTCQLLGRPGPPDPQTGCVCHPMSVSTRTYLSAPQDSCKLFPFALSLHRQLGAGSGSPLRPGPRPAGQLIERIMVYICPQTDRGRGQG